MYVQDRALPNLSPLGGSTPRYYERNMPNKMLPSKNRQICGHDFVFYCLYCICGTKNTKLRIKNNGITIAEEGWFPEGLKSSALGQYFLFQSPKSSVFLKVQVTVKIHIVSPTQHIRARVMEPVLLTLLII